MYATLALQRQQTHSYTNSIIPNAHTPTQIHSKTNPTISFASTIIRQLLYNTGTQMLLSTIQRGYSEDIIHYTTRVPISHSPIYNGATQKSLSTKSWGHPKLIIYYIMEVPKSDYLLYNGGTQKTLSAIEWG